MVKDNYVSGVRLRDMALNERPQERMERYGGRTLKDAELLAMLLRSGSKDRDVVAVSEGLIAQAGSLSALLCWTKEDFMKLHGVGRVKALQLLTVMEIARRILERRTDSDLPFDGPDRVYDYCRSLAMGIEVEKFWTLSLNRKNRLIKCSEVTSGTASSSLVHAREVFREAIKSGASAVIAVHNHPSGDPAPSSADIRVTRQLREASEVIGIEFLDHVILGSPEYTEDSTGYYSFNDGGLL